MVYGIACCLTESIVIACLNYRQEPGIARGPSGYSDRRPRCRNSYGGDIEYRTNFVPNANAERRLPDAVSTGFLANNLNPHGPRWARTDR
jgi:hypothetical protein